MGAEAARFWSSWTGGLFEQAAYHSLPVPLERILRYLDLRVSLLEGPVEAFTCYAGTTVQECFATSDAIRDACSDSIVGLAKATGGAAIVRETIAHLRRYLLLLLDPGREEVRA